MPLKHTLLALVRWSPMHGYRLRQLAGMYSWIYPMKNASIYPALHALEEDGFVTHRSEIHDGRARKIYEITNRGRDELSHWLSQAADQELTFRDQMLLKIAMQSDASAPHAAMWVEETLETIRVQIDEHDRNLKGADDVPTYTRLAMEYGVDMLRLRARLLEQVLESSNAA